MFHSLKVLKGKWDIFFLLLRRLKILSENGLAPGFILNPRFEKKPTMERAPAGLSALASKILSFYNFLYNTLINNLHIAIFIPKRTSAFAFVSNVKSINSAPCYHSLVSSLDVKLSISY